MYYFFLDYENMFHYHYMELTDVIIMVKTVMKTILIYTVSTHLDAET